MISDKIKGLVAWRLKIVKYAYASGFYWNSKDNRLVLSNNNEFWTWSIYLSAGIWVVPLMSLYIYLNLSKNGESRANTSDKTAIYKPLTLVFTVAIICLLICAMLQASILKHNRQRVCNMYEMTFQLDMKIKGKLLIFIQRYPSL